MQKAALRRLAGVLFVSLWLTGCASQIMERYLGKTLQDVMIDYGPPLNAFDMPDGTRAFQWVLTQTYVMPTTVTTSGNVTGMGNMSLWSSQSQISGGHPIQHSCAYTMFARWQGNAWIFQSFRKPPLSCE